MHLYSLTLQKSTMIQKAIYGNFSENKAHQILVSRGRYLEIYKIDEKYSFLIEENSISSIQKTFSESSGTLQQSDSKEQSFVNQLDKDFIIVLSDSGKIIILQFDPIKKQFSKMLQQTYGKTGCRRIVPGQYVACDPKGRSFMIGAIEKQKYVYIMARENQQLNILSPLQVHKSHTLCMDMIAIDVGLQNSQFACIQIDYGQSDDENALVVKGGKKKHLVYYQMDFGLNHVVRKFEFELPDSSYKLLNGNIQLLVPGQENGPGGIIVLCEDFLLYRDVNCKEREVKFPVRIGPKHRGMYIISHAFMKFKDLFFYLIQTQLGDIFQIMFDFKKTQVFKINIEYYDTLPPAISLCITKNGYLFCAAEKGPQQLFIISRLYKFINVDNKSLQAHQSEFLPTPITNLLKSDQLENMNSITDIKVADLKGQGTPQIYVFVAAACRSQIKIMKQGLSIQEQASSQFPSKSTAIFTIPENPGITCSTNPTKYIIISYTNTTKVLKIFEEKITPIKDHFFDQNNSTIHVAYMDSNCYVQVNQHGLHIVHKNKVSKWVTQGKILKATSNLRQLIVGLAGGDIFYFQIVNQTLMEIKQSFMDSQIISIDIPDIPQNRVRAEFAAIGLSDHTVRIFSLYPDNLFKRLSIQALPSTAQSVALVQMMNDEFTEQNLIQQFYLYVGLSNGVLLRVTIDQITGNLSDKRTRFLGAKPVKLCKMRTEEKLSLLALSSRSWLIYNYLGKHEISPLSYGSLDHAAIFNSNAEQRMVCISEKFLKIIKPKRLGQMFNYQSIGLRYSPRKVLITKLKKLIILQADQKTFCQEERKSMMGLFYQNKLDSLQEEKIGRLVAPEGCWGSCIRIFNPQTMKTQKLIQIQNNIACVSICKFRIEKEQESYICVGCVRELITNPKKSFKEAFIITYKWNQQNLEEYHITPVQDVPLAMHQYKNKLLVGVGLNLRAYEMGKKKLLKKAEIKGLYSPINTIHTYQDRIYCSQIADSFHIFKYKQKEQTFYDIADDILPRWTTATCLLDYHTLAGADKFQNIYISRAPHNADQDYENNPNSYKFRWENGYLNGAPFKMQQICNMFVGDLITCIQKAALIPTSSQLIIYGTSGGSIGVLLPFDSREDIDFFTHLQIYLRNQCVPLCGRDHIAYRSYYGPCKNIIDGDLCDKFQSLSYQKQIQISNEVDCTPQQIHKKIDQIKNKIF